MEIGDSQIKDKNIYISMKDNKPVNFNQELGFHQGPF